MTNADPQPLVNTVGEERWEHGPAHHRWHTSRVESAEPIEIDESKRTWHWLVVVVLAVEIMQQSRSKWVINIASLRSDSCSIFLLDVQDLLEFMTLLWGEGTQSERISLVY